MGSTCTTDDTNSRTTSRTTSHTIDEGAGTATARSHPLGTRRTPAVVLALAAALTFSGCGNGGDDAADESAASEPASEPASGDDAAAATEDIRDLAIGGGAARDEEGGGTIDLGQVGRAVIVEMYVTVASDDIERAVASVTARAATLGGGIASSDVDYGRLTDDGRPDGYAVLVVKVPPDAVDDLLSGLEQAGTIRSINQSAQDVTDQLVDLDVRIANARESVENVRAFMERTENLSELVTLEGELTRRQTELERLEAQQRNLSDRVALSTVTVDIVPADSVPLVDEDQSIGDAFRQGWDGFVTTVWGIGFVLAVLAPFLAVALVAAAVVLWATRRRRHPDDRDHGDEVATAVPAPPVEQEEPAAIGAD